MRGLGDFQRSQMKNTDPRVSEFFGHLRNAVDILEQIVMRASSSAAEEPAEPRSEKPKQPIVAELQKTERLAYGVKEASKLLGISRGTVYRLIQNEELSAIRLGRRTLKTSTDCRSGSQRSISFSHILRRRAPRVTISGQNAEAVLAAFGIC